MVDGAMALQKTADGAQIVLTHRPTRRDTARAQVICASMCFVGDAKMVAL